MIICCIICLIIGLAAGALVVRSQLYPQVARTRELDYKTEQRNRELNDELNELSYQRDILLNKIDSLDDNIEKLEKQASQSADIFYKQSMEIANQNIEKSMEQLAKKYEVAEQEYDKEYQQVLKEAVEDYQQQTKAHDEEINRLLVKIDEMGKEIQDLTSRKTAMVEAEKREEALRAKEAFYKIQLSETDLQEIEKLREVAPYLRNKEPLNKIIWKCYYEKPVNDLIGRVIGPGIHTGIYRITNLENGMCYVGQSIDLSSRWKQHVKRGLGAETPTRNKLYPAMMSVGVENFSFEVVEECAKAQLDAREDYWQDFYHAIDFGYSIK